MKEFLYDSASKMSEMITAHPGLVMMLPRFGIELGFGDKSIGEVCRLHGVDAGFFLLMCNVYTFDNYVPTAHVIDSTDLTHLVDYLRRSHQYYVEKRLPHIERHLQHMASALPDRVATVFMHFFSTYKNEVVAHFGHEEERVFPHIEALQRGHSDDSYQIDAFLASHSNIEDKLDDLLQIIFKYLPPQAMGDDAISVVYDILQLSHDLRKHSLIEEKILVPYVTHLERTVS